MMPIDTLKHEHEIVLSVLEAAERESESIQQTGQVNTDKIEKMLDFFKNFVDHCHHKKEEQGLFVKMQERGLPYNSGPLAVMLYEHEEGREISGSLLKTLAAAKSGDRQAVEALNNQLSAYIKLLWDHIDKENTVLFPLANRVLQPEDQDALIQAFARIEMAEVGEGVHEKYHHLAQELSRT